MSETPLCAVDDIPDRGPAGFVAQVGGQRVGVIALRFGGKVFTYENSCPHIGTPLDFQPGNFLNAEKTHIICATHGALFRIGDGHCVSGPCAGKGLVRLTNTTRRGTVYLTGAALSSK